MRSRLLLTLLLICSGAIYILSTPVFKVRNIYVRGNAIVPSDKVIQLSGIKPGDNLLRLNTSKIDRRIKTNSYIGSATVKRNPVGDVYLVISERSAAGISAYGKKYVTMDKKGAIIEIIDTKDGINLPLITGLGIKNAVSGSTVAIEDDRKLKSMEEIFNSVKTAGLSDIIIEADLNDLQSIRIKTKYGIVLKIGNTDDIDRKLEACKAIMDQDLIKKGLKGTIDVSYKGNPVFRPDNDK